MSNRDFAAKQLNKIRNRIERAALDAGRRSTDISLIGASKMHSSQIIRSFQEQGLRHIGENYLQEAIRKRSELTDLNLHWHFIGKIQSNKTALVARHFSWVHGVDRLKIAQRLAQHRSKQAETKALQVLVQINIDDEASKSGASALQVPALCDAISQLDFVQLRGLMLIPKMRQDHEQQRRPYATAREILELSNQRFGLNMKHLSMGMSNDLEAAIAEGATMLRIGTALFGARPES